MASFLDNTSDIVLDAVLTDYGRQLLAKGDGSFKIVKFAFGDDEIDYSLWDSTAATTLKDTDIVRTPVLEAFTNNAASLKNKLLTIGIENLLYLPVMKLNAATGSFNNNFNGFVVSIDELNAATVDSPITGSTTAAVSGLLNYKNQTISIDQGLDSLDLNSSKALSVEIPELYEKEYNIIIDNRLGRIHADAGADTPPQPVVSVDDDNMATYRITQTGNGTMITDIGGTGNGNGSPIRGYRGSRLTFSIRPTLTIASETVLDRLGEVVELASAADYRTVRTSVQIVGITTGYSVDLPILFAKRKTT
jgi:hypothetical protein